MGGELRLRHFDELMHESLPRCKDPSVTCMLLDPSGYIIWHHAFACSASIDKRVFVGDLYPELATKMVSDGALSAERCVAFSDGFVRSPYTLRREVQGSVLSCGWYATAPVPGVAASLVVFTG